MDHGALRVQFARQRVEWNRSPERKWAFLYVALSLACGNAVSYYSYQRFRTDGDLWGYYSTIPIPSKVGWNTVFSMLFGLCFAALLYSRQRSLHRDRLTLEQAQQGLATAEAGLNATSGDRDTPPGFLQLWEVTQKRLDYYHEIVTAQAKQSFRNAQLAMAAGFVVLLVAVALSAQSNNVTGAVITGVLGTAGATLGAYIGRTFVRTQEKSAEHLQSYFVQPLQLSKYLAAERLITQASPASRDAAIRDMALSMVEMRDGFKRHPVVEEAK